MEGVLGVSLVKCDTTLALRCPICGKLDLEGVNIFDFSGTDKLNIDCSCGFTKLTIVKRGYKRYYMEYNCVVCESKHRVFYNQSQLWSKEIKGIRCTNNGAELGYLGSYAKVKKLAEEEREYLELLAENLEFEDYFSNPEIMLSILDELHNIAEKNGLVCQCGSTDIDIDMLPGEVKLTCNNCKGVIKVSAESTEDLMFLKKLRKVRILEGVVKVLEKPNF